MVALEGIDERFLRSLANPTDVVVTEHAECVYVLSQGQRDWGMRYWESDDDWHEQSYEESAANVLMATLDGTGHPQAASAWTGLLNSLDGGDDVIQYDVTAALLPPHYAGILAPEIQNEVLPLLHGIVVDPGNPRHFYIGNRTQGFGADENFHKNNGIWEHAVVGGAGQWTQVKGGVTGEPCKGINALAISPIQGVLVGSSAGQELFTLGISLAVPPVDGLVALEPVHPGQSLILVTSAPAADIGSVVDIWIDARPLGGAARVHLSDNGDIDVSGDWAAGDGIWTVDLGELAIAEDQTVTLDCCACDADWNSFYGEVAVEVLAEAPAQFFRNVSAELDPGFTYSGTPSGLSGVDLLPQVGDEDDLRDLVMSQMSADVRLFQNTSPLGGVPSFLDLTYERFESFAEAPTADHGPTIVADLDNDGHRELTEFGWWGEYGEPRTYRRLPRCFVPAALTTEFEALVEAAKLVADLGSPPPDGTD